MIRIWLLVLCSIFLVGCLSANVSVSVGDNNLSFSTSSHENKNCTEQEVLNRSNTAIIALREKDKDDFVKACNSDLCSGIWYDRLSAELELYTTPEVNNQFTNEGVTSINYTDSSFDTNNSLVLNFRNDGCQMVSWFIPRG